MEHPRLILPRVHPSVKIRLVVITTVEHVVRPREKRCGNRFARKKSILRMFRMFRKSKKSKQKEREEINGFAEEAEDEGGNEIGRPTAENGVKNPIFEKKPIRTKSSRSLSSLTDVGRSISRKFGLGRRGSAAGDKVTRVVIAGTEGAGKTTLFKALLNISEMDVEEETNEGMLEGRMRYRGVEFRLTDLSNTGSPLEWLDAFEGASAVVFVASLGAYDEVDEGSGMNKLEQSLDLFHTMINNKFLTDATIVLILNKVDTFKDKLLEKKIPLNQSGDFSDAPEGNSYDDGLKWIKSKYASIAGRKKARAMLVEVANATEPEKYAKQLDACARKIIKRKKGKRLDNML